MMTNEKAITWLKECAKYFGKRVAETEEDATFWDMTNNIQSAKNIVTLIEKNQENFDLMCKYYLSSMEGDTYLVDEAYDLLKREGKVDEDGFPIEKDE